MNRTLVGEVQALCTPTVLDQQTLELARSLELRSGAYRAPALPVELYQRSWRGDSNADHGLTRPALFPLSYASKTLERTARVELASLVWKTRAPAAIPRPLVDKELAGDEGLEPSYLDLEASVLAAGRISRELLAELTGIEPVPADRRSAILPIDHSSGSLPWT